MTSAEKLAEALALAESSVDYWRDIAVTDFTRELHARMESLKVSQGELARRMGTSRPYVTKLLEGSNFTLQTMVKLAMALEAVVRLRLEGKEERLAELRAATLMAASEGAVIDLGQHRRFKPMVVSTEDDSVPGTITRRWSV